MDINQSSADKRVKFHFPEMKKEFDEWIGMVSNRIAPHRLFSRSRIISPQEFRTYEDAVDSKEGIVFTMVGKKENDRRDLTVRAEMSVVPNN